MTYKLHSDKQTYRHSFKTSGQEGYREVSLSNDIQVTFRHTDIHSGLLTKRVIEELLLLSILYLRYPLLKEVYQGAMQYPGNNISLIFLKSASFEIKRYTLYMQPGVIKYAVLKPVKERKEGVCNLYRVDFEKRTMNCYRLYILRGSRKKKFFS